MKDTNLYKGEDDTSRDEDIPLERLLLSRGLLAAAHIVGALGEAGGVQLPARPALAQRVCARAARRGHVAPQDGVVLRAVHAAAFVLQEQPAVLTG